MYKIKVFYAPDILTIEERINDFLSSDAFKDCVIISTELKDMRSTMYFCLVYFNRRTAESRRGDL